MVFGFVSVRNPRYMPLLWSWESSSWSALISPRKHVPKTWAVFCSTSYERRTHSERRTARNTYIYKSWIPFYRTQEISRNLDFWEAKNEKIQIGNQHFHKLGRNLLNPTNRIPSSVSRRRKYPNLVNKRLFDTYLLEKPGKNSQNLVSCTFLHVSKQPKKKCPP